jgi:class 3 adenylate cyclase/tetratricopeptide (TPR) repeat protein
MQAFLAPYVVRFCADRSTPPVEEAFPATLLFGDIQGFTPLTERLAEQGPQGAEALSRLLNVYFNTILEGLREAGGEVVYFAGDALLAAWPGPFDTTAPAAAAAALDVQQRLARLEGVEKLALRIGLGCGQVRALHLGGQRVLCLWESDAIEQAATAEAKATAGTVAASPEAWLALGDRASGTARRVTAVEAGPPRPVSVPQNVTDLRAYLSPSLRDRLEAGQGDWLAELRNVTTLFVHLIPADTRLDTLQRVVETVQNALAADEVELRHLLKDDKGLVVVGVLGLPASTHDNDSARGLHTALMLHSSLASLGCQASVGVTTGRAFCGPVGNGWRREYTVLGDVINLAARLMAQAAPILCDRTTMEAAHGQYRFDRPEPLRVKGKRAPVPVFVPVGRLQPASSATASLVGREEELAMLWRLADQGVPMCVEGEAGIGKSTLLATFAAQASERGWVVLEGAADPLERAPWQAWQRIVGTALGQVASFAGTAWLSDIVPTGLPEPDLDGVERSQATQDAALDLLQAAAGTRPLMVILDDVHWLDAASQELLVRASKRDGFGLLVLGTRPGRESVLPQARHIGLRGLQRGDVTRFIARRLDRPVVAPNLAELIWTRSDGNPFFAEELLHALQERRAIALADGQAALVAGEEGGDVLPRTVEGVVTSRIDRLAPSEQMTLKTASVVGRAFSVPPVTALHPIVPERPAVPSHLETLATRDFTLPEAEHYIFKHAITHQVAYNLLPFSQRQELHRRAARWYEDEDPDELGTIAWHWQEGDAPAQAMHALVRCGEQAARQGVHADAVRHFEAALELAATRVADPPPAEDRARWHMLAAEAHLGLGAVDKSETHLLDAARLLDLHLPEGERFAGRLWALVLKGLLPQGPCRVERAIAQARVLDNLAQIYFHQGRKHRSQYAALAGLKLARQAGPCEELARIESEAGLAAALMRNMPIADYFLGQAREVARVLDRPAVNGWVSMVEGLARATNGQVRDAGVCFEHSMRVAEETHLSRRWEEAACGVAGIAVLEGRPDISLPLAQRVFEAARESGNQQTMVWALQLYGWQQVLRGRLAEAVETLERSLAPAQQLPKADWINGLACLSWVRAMQGDKAQADALLQQALSLMAETQPTGFLHLAGYLTVAESGLLLSPSRAEAALRQLKRFARTFVVGRPAAWRHRAWKAWREGDRTTARAHLRRSQASAARMGMPIERALAQTTQAHFFGDVQPCPEVEALCLP